MVQDRLARFVEEVLLPFNFPVEVCGAPRCRRDELFERRRVPELEVEEQVRRRRPRGPRLRERLREDLPCLGVPSGFRLEIREMVRKMDAAGRVPGESADGLRDLGVTGMVRRDLRDDRREPRVRARPSPAVERPVEPRRTRGLKRHDPRREVVLRIGHVAFALGVAGPQAEHLGQEIAVVDEGDRELGLGLRFQDPGGGGGHVHGGVQTQLDEPQEVLRPAPELLRPRTVANGHEPRARLAEKPDVLCFLAGAESVARRRTARPAR